jgi:hypothetical protein
MRRSLSISMRNFHLRWEYILVLQKAEESPFSADEDSFIIEVAKEEMLKFKDQISHPKNTAKLDAAIEKLPMDIAVIK